MEASLVLCSPSRVLGRTIFDERHIHVVVVLNDGAGGQDGLGILGIMGQRIA